MLFFIIFAISMEKEIAENEKIKVFFIIYN